MTALVCDKKQGLTCEQATRQEEECISLNMAWSKTQSFKIVILVLAAFHSLVFRPIVRKL